MTTIAYLNTKGGVGKTTSSIMTAEAARRAGYSSAVIDADPQGSASEWAEAAAANGDPLRFTVEVANRVTMARRVAGNSAQYLFIDTAPNDPAVIQAAVDVADLTIIPSRSTPADLHRAIQTYQSISGAAALLLWNVDPRHQLYKQARELFEVEDIAAFAAEIPSREDVNKLWSTSINTTSLYGYEEVFAELHGALTEGDTK